MPRTPPSEVPDTTPPVLCDRLAYGVAYYTVQGEDAAWQWGLGTTYDAEALSPAFPSQHAAELAAEAAITGGVAHGEPTE